MKRLVLALAVAIAGTAKPGQQPATGSPPVPVPELAIELKYESIDEAIARGDLEDVRAHLRKNAETARQGKHPRLRPLHQAILRKQTEIAVLLIKSGADVDAPDPSGRTPAHLAVERDNPVILKALLDAGAKPNTLDGTGWAPLHHAAAKNRLKTAEILLARGADPMTLSKRGGTPLHEAAASGGLELVNLLLKAGVDPKIRSQTGHTALDIAREHQNADAAKRLSFLSD